MEKRKVGVQKVAMQGLLNVGYDPLADPVHDDCVVICRNAAQREDAYDREA